MTGFSKFVQAKIRAAIRGTATRTEPVDQARLPPGQRLVTNFPVLDLGQKPKIRRTAWQLEITGEVENPVVLNWQEFLDLPQTCVTADIHCVTHWTRLDVPWAGVHIREITACCKPRSGAEFVTLHSYDGYTTNLPLAELLHEDSLLAHSVDGGRLSAEHGGPVRMVVPQRYFWKSAKWISKIEFHKQDQPGFWETHGYHNEADPWKQQRYRAQKC